MAKANEIKYLTAIKAEKRPKKYCRFKKMGIRYIDYKDADFLKKFLKRFWRMQKINSSLILKYLKISRSK